MAGQRKGWSGLSEPYRNRLEKRGISRAAYESGKSLSRARGQHPSAIKRFSRAKFTAVRSPEAFLKLSGRQQSDYQKSRQVLRMSRRQGISLSRASKEVGIDPRTVIKLAGPGFKRQGRRYVPRANDSLWRQSYVLTRDIDPSTGSAWHPVNVYDFRTASLLGRYNYALGQYSSDSKAPILKALRLAKGGATNPLAEFKGKSVTIEGRKYELITDPAVLKDLLESDALEYPESYFEGGSP